MTDIEILESLKSYTVKPEILDKAIEALEQQEKIGHRDAGGREMKGLFIPGITAEMFRNGCLESIEALMAEGEIYDIDYQQPCDDCISREKALNVVHRYFEHYLQLNDDICLDGLRSLPSVTPKEKITHCKDCKWWKDSDGVYRRGVGAESKCPINTKTVYLGNGYCYRYEPRESEASMTENERKTMIILADTITGEINRMCVTKELAELDTMCLHAKKNLEKLSKMIYDSRFKAESEDKK